MKKVLAIDMGATSIRGILGFIKDGKLGLKEVMRAKHTMSEKGERLRWDMPLFISNIEKAILENKDEIVSVGIDTWGVDFGLLDKDLKLIDEPICYRDSKHKEGFDEATSKMSEKEIFKETGTQLMVLNTLFQLLAYRKLDLKKYSEIQKIVMMPDLIQFLLTGNVVGEETIWSTSQLFDISKYDYSDEIINRFNLDRKIFPQLVTAGTLTGTLKGSQIESLKNLDINVVSVCGHDTASAVFITKAMTDEDYMFLSCGTWSLFGVRKDKCDMSEVAYEYNMTNELGYGHANLFFKNMTGLYLLEKFKEQYEKELGRKLDFEEINKHVLSVFEEREKDELWKKIVESKGRAIVDMDYEEFAKEDVNAKKAILEYLVQKDLPYPAEDMTYFAVIYESMVYKYLEIKKQIEKITGKVYKKIHIIGGGAKSPLLCQLVADILNVEVLAGPFEASALGNILIQLEKAGEVKDFNDGIELVYKSQEVKTYKPNL